MRHFVLSVQVSVTFAVSTTTVTPGVWARAASEAPGAATALTVTVLGLVVCVVVFAVLGVVGRRAVALRAASVTVASTAFAPRSAVVVLVLCFLLLGGSEEATWNLFPELVGELVCAVVEGFEC
jgi:heme/copper-type cytochrome/quinol oxidase subunit 4